MGFCNRTHLHSTTQGYRTTRAPSLAVPHLSKRPSLGLLVRRATLEAPNEGNRAVKDVWATINRQITQRAFVSSPENSDNRGQVN